MCIICILYVYCMCIIIYVYYTVTMADLNHVDGLVIITDLTQEGLVEGGDFVQREPDWFVQLEAVVYVSIITQVRVTVT